MYVYVVSNNPNAFKERVFFFFKSEEYYPERHSTRHFSIRNIVKGLGITKALDESELKLRNVSIHFVIRPAHKQRF